MSVHLFDYQVDMLEEGLDLWVTNNECIPQGYVAKRVADSKFVAVASPEYLVNHKHLVTNDLKHHNCLIYRGWQRHYNGWAFSKSNQHLNIKSRGIMRLILPSIGMTIQDGVSLVGHISFKRRV